MQAATDSHLAATGLTVSVAGRTLVEELDLELRSGELIALLGKNGTGKTLLLHTLAGVRAPAKGSISIDGDPATSLGRRELAQKLVLMPQHSDDVFPASVLETALVGRHPHIDRLGFESGDDLAAARSALADVDLAELEDRDVLTLSGGERRRLAIAECLAQDTPLILLDEPTNHLDPQHRLDALALFRGLADRGRGLLVSMHDVNEAACYADRCLLLYGDGRWELGDKASILSSERLESLYGTAMDVIPWRGRQVFVAAGTSERNP